MVRSCLLVTLIKCPKGHKCVGSLCRLVKTLIVSLVRPSKQDVQFGHKQFENPSKIPIVVTVKAKGYSQLEYILHLFLKITISAYYNYLQVKIIFLSNMEPVFLLLPPWQVSPNWGRTHCGTNTSIQSLNTHFQPLAFLNQTSSRSSYHSDQEDSIIN